MPDSKNLKKRFKSLPDIQAYFKEDEFTPLFEAINFICAYINSMSMDLEVTKEDVSYLLKETERLDNDMRGYDP